MPSAILTVPAKVLSVFLAFVFIMAGLGKLTPWHPMYEQLSGEAPKWLDALRLSAFGIDADTLRIAIGAAELALGLLILVTPIAGYGLAAVMGGALATHFIMDGNKVTAEMTPALVFSALLGVHAVLHGAIKAAAKAEAQADTAGKDD